MGVEILKFYLLVVLGLAIAQYTNSQPLEGRIINGKEADWFGTKYQVSIRLKFAEFQFGGGHTCGGTLISRNVVLSSSMCLFNFMTNSVRLASELTIVMGNVNRLVKDDTILQFNVAKIVGHPGFSMQHFANDLAILFLDGEVPEDYERAFPIEMNTEPNLEPGTQCELSGWGMTKKLPLSPVLLTADAFIRDHSECEALYKSFFQKGMLCSASLNGDSGGCAADSGGPLVCDGKLAGIFSGAMACAVPGIPSISTNIVDYLDWINEELAKE